MVRVMRLRGISLYLAALLALVAGASHAACVCPAPGVAEPVVAVAHQHSHAAHAAHAGHDAMAAEADPAAPCHEAKSDCPDAHQSWAQAPAPDLVAAPIQMAVALPAPAASSPLPALRLAAAAFVPRPPPVLRTSPVARRTLLLI